MPPAIAGRSPRQRKWNAPPHRPAPEQRVRAPVEGQEIAHCRDFLRATIAGMPNLAAIVALGRIAHDTTAVALGQRVSAVKFGHGATHVVGTLTVFDSYHCSRYNTNTGVLTTQMFRAVFAAVRAYLDARSHAATTPAL
jgi:uracil-DNA glycosylase